MRWVNIYEEYRNVIYDILRVKHIYRRVGSLRFYICQYSLQSEINSVGTDFARKFYLVKTYGINEKKPQRFEIKTGDIVRCYYSRPNKHQHFTLLQIITRKNKEVIYPHLCSKDKPIEVPMLTLFE